MAAPRTYWKGHLRLSLVTVEVALYSATERGASLSLRQIHKPSGRRIRYEKVAEGLGPVKSEEIVKGFELGDDGYVVLEPEELDEIKLESSRAIRLVQFVDQSEVDPRYFEKPYYVAPQGEAAAEGFVVIREALRRAKKIGLGQMTLRGREHLVAIRPCGKGLLLETLRYGAEVRKADSVFDDIPEAEPDDDMLGLATQLIENKSASFDPNAFQDSYAAALRELIERKRKGKAIVAIGEEKKGKGGEVVDLMEALKKSLGQQKGAKGAQKPPAKRAPRRKAG
jgi:DNA end-binding protein Ku